MYEYEYLENINAASPFDDINYSLSSLRLNYSVLLTVFTITA
jgi:hypothetical protein